MNRSAALGLFAVVFGFAVVARNGLAGVIGIGGVDLFVSGVGALAVVQGLRYANEARHTEHRAVATADAEDRYEVPSPGDDVDEFVRTASAASHASVRERRELRDRLGDAARTTLRTRGSVGSDDDVDAALRDGTWTDDPVAAWFLGETPPTPASVRARSLAGSNTQYRFVVRRTIAAIAAVEDGVDAPRPAPSSMRWRLAEAAVEAGRRPIRAVRRLREVSR
ncbi:DUF7269 family protein [Halobaculum sp. D14]|uniref:DUF7269 family protein n=1 Tax=Halobaculum sp. D14 TaxID=3421642 RepID=UPI003EB799D8